MVDFRPLQQLLRQPWQGPGGSKVWRMPPLRIEVNLLLWCVPALLVGGLLRLWMMQGWQEGHYYGPDSLSYWETVYRCAKGEAFETSDKRPPFYSWLMLITQWGPRSPAFAAAGLQHLFGWLTVLPLAAILRHLLTRWRWWIVPATVLYACHPQLLYWEHVLIADSLFVALALCAVWAFFWFWREPQEWGVLALTLGIVFVAMATRPVGRALWLSMMPLMLVLPGLSWRERGVRLALLLVLYPMADKATRVKQADSLMFASAFPLMVLDRPPHQELKGEFAAAVKEDRANLWRYVSKMQRERWSWLDGDNAPKIGPHYTELVQDKRRRTAVTKELTRQGVLAAPFTYAWMISLKVYHLCSLNSMADRLEPSRFASGSLKFLRNSRENISPDFPVFLFRDERAATPEGIAAVIDEQLAGQAAQERVMGCWPWLTRLSSLYRLPADSLTLPAPRDSLPLLLFLTGSIACFWLPNGRNYLPLFVLGAGYIVLTLIVGRAVERYRLPAEYLLFCGVFLGLDCLVTLGQHWFVNCLSKWKMPRLPSP